MEQVINFLKKFLSPPTGGWGRKAEHALFLLVAIRVLKFIRQRGITACLKLVCFCFCFWVGCEVFEEGEGVMFCFFDSFCVCWFVCVEGKEKANALFLKFLCQDGKINFFFNFFFY